MKILSAIGFLLLGTCQVYSGNIRQAVEEQRQQKAEKKASKVSRNENDEQQSQQKVEKTAIDVSRNENDEQQNQQWSEKKERLISLNEVTQEQDQQRSEQKMGMIAKNQEVAPPCQQSSGKKGAKVSSKQDRISRLQIGGNYTHASIKILDQSLFHGDLGGAQGLYEYRPWNNFYAGLSAAWKQGKTENSDATRTLVYIDVHERLGYTFATRCRKWLMTLFTGFGYRHLGHKLEQPGQKIKFEYNEFYVPLGWVSDYFFNSWFAGGLNFTWMPQVYPTVKIVPLNGARWIIRSSINNFIVELPLTFYPTKCKLFSLIFKPFYEYWQDGKSTAKTSTGLALDLPGNVYNFWGAELNFAFSF